MAKFLIVYGTKQGQTEKIAKFIRDEIESFGHAVKVFDSDKNPPTLANGEFDAAIIGAPVHASGFPRSLKVWARNNSKVLNQIPSTFFSVCLGILQQDSKVQIQERVIVLDFFSWAKWYPKTWTVFAGALIYSKYNWLLKRIMHFIAKRAGSETDISRDYEYTDWGQVRKFASEFIYSVAKNQDKKQTGVVIKIDIGIAEQDRKAIAHE